MLGLVPATVAVKVTVWPTVMLLGEAVTVVFEVPRTLGILEKDKGKEKQKEGEDR